MASYSRAKSVQQIQAFRPSMIEGDFFSQSFFFLFWTSKGDTQASSCKGHNNALVQKSLSTAMNGNVTLSEQLMVNQVMLHNSAWQVESEKSLGHWTCEIPLPEESEKNRF